MQLEKYSHQRLILIIGILCILLAACGSRQAATHTSPATKALSTGAPSPTRVKTTFTPFPSPTFTPSPAAIPSPSPTVATPPRPSRTPRPSITPSPTLSIQELATLSARGTQGWATRHAEETMAGTWESRWATEIAILPGCQSPISHDYSPSGNWVVVRCMEINNPTGVYNLKNHSQAWLLTSRTIFGDDLHEWATYIIYPMKWTADERFLFLKIYPCCVDGPCLDSISGIALIRLDLLTGKVARTLPPDAKEGFYNFTLSPDDTYLAYTRTWLERPILNLVNLVTGEEHKIPIDERFAEVVDFIWSPDGRQLAFSARASIYCENTTYYMVIMDLDDYEQTLLLESDKAEYSPVEWTADDHIIIYLGYEKGYGIFDLETGEIIPYLTPTPAE